VSQQWSRRQASHHNASGTGNVAITDVVSKSNYSGKCILVAFWSQFRNGLIPPEYVTPGMVILAGLSAILHSSGFQQESVGHDKDLPHTSELTYMHPAWTCSYLQLSARISMYLSTVCW